MKRNRISLAVPAGPRRGWAYVVADPPWSFSDKGSRIAPDQRSKRRRRRGYRTLDLEQVKGLGAQLAPVLADDALLFLWTTSAHLVDGSARKVARAWGFVPKATIAWVKVRPPKETQITARFVWTGECFAPHVQIGMGHYVRHAHELVVVCARGRAARLVKDRGVPSVLFAPRGEHSRKPDAFRRLVDRIAGGGRVLELFARSSWPGWTAWGDQATHAGSTELSTRLSTPKVTASSGG